MEKKCVQPADLTHKNATTIPGQFGPSCFALKGHHMSVRLVNIMACWNLRLCRATWMLVLFVHACPLRTCLSSPYAHTINQPHLFATQIKREDQSEQQHVDTAARWLYWCSVGLCIPDSCYWYVAC